MRVIRTVEVILGAVFIFSALTKALDLYAFAVQVSYYNVVRDPALVEILARVLVAIETLLGAVLLAGSRFRRTALLATAALLVAFSGLTAYAWVFQGLEDCGCFGKYIQMGPEVSLVKNALLLALTAAAWLGWRRHTQAKEGMDRHPSRRPVWAYVLASFGVGAVLVAALANAPSGAPPVSTDKDIPFAHFDVSDGAQTLNLGKGEYLVAMLSATCEHCQTAADLLNELEYVPGIPPIVGLMMGDEEEMQEFQEIAAPNFPVRSIDTLEFFNLIGKEPPRFYIVRDGKAVRHLDVLDPTLEDLETFVLEPADPAALSLLQRKPAPVLPPVLQVPSASRNSAWSVQDQRVNGWVRSANGRSTRVPLVYDSNTA